MILPCGQHCSHGRRSHAVNPSSRTKVKMKLPKLELKRSLLLDRAVLLSGQGEQEVEMAGKGKK